MATRINAADARAEFAELMNQVAYGKDRVILTRRGRDVVAIVPIEDVEFLERLEDKTDAEKVHARRNEATSLIEEAVARLGLGKPKRKKSA